MKTNEHSDLAPYSPEGEQGILGCILMAPECMDETISELRSGGDVFYDLRNRTIYEAMVILHREGSPIDTLSLRPRLHKSIELSYVSALQDKVAHGGLLDRFLRVVLDNYYRRRLIQECQKAAKRADEEADVATLLAQTENAIATIVQTESIKTLDGADTADRLVEDLQRRYDLQGRRSGISTGWDVFDEMTDGLQFGEQTIIAARPSIGKTAMAVNLADKVCLRDGIPTAFVTLEMSPAALAKRILATKGCASMKSLRTGQLTPEEFAAFTAFNRTLKEAPFFIIDGVAGLGVDLLCALVKRLWRKHGIKLVLIDYLQKIRPSSRSEKRTYEVAAVSGTLKSLAVELNLALVTLAQLGREMDKEKGRLPRLSDLADSAQIERDADVVALLHRKWEKPYDAKLIVAKQRDGETGVVNLTFTGKYCRFENPKKSDAEDQSIQPILPRLTNSAQADP